MGYRLLYADSDHEDCEVEEVIDHETYDVFRSMLEIFGNRRDFLTVSQVINHVQCFDAQQMSHRLQQIFDGKLSRSAREELDKVVQIEHDNNCEDDEALFLEIPL